MTQGNILFYDTAYKFTLVYICKNQFLYSNEEYYSLKISKPVNILTIYK